MASCVRGLRRAIAEMVDRWTVEAGGLEDARHRIDRLGIEPGTVLAAFADLRAVLLRLAAALFEPLGRR